MLPTALFLIAGEIAAMAALVAAIAGIATVTTQKLAQVFSGGDPKDKDLQQSLEDWRAELKAERASLMRLKRGELDLLAQQPVVVKASRSSVVSSGTLQSIYQEKIAQFRRRTYPKAKVPQTLTIVQTATTEYVYRLRGVETLITVDGQPLGAFRQNRLYAAGKPDAIAGLDPQTDARTVHVEHLVPSEHTIGILLRSGTSRLPAPRAFEFVDVNTDEQRLLLEALSFHFLLTENMPPA